MLARSSEAFLENNIGQVVIRRLYRNPHSVNRISVYSEGLYTRYGTLFPFICLLGLILEFNWGSTLLIRSPVELQGHSIAPEYRQ